MTSKDVTDLYFHLKEQGVAVWIDGGWCCDALLGKELRPHKDLDIALQWKDVPKLREVLTGQGFTQTKEDNQWNFVMTNEQGLEVDVHAFVSDDKGNVIDGIMYPKESLTGVGLLNGETVNCIAPKYMVEFLAPWIHKWPEKYLPAVAALCEVYKIELPKEYNEFKKV